ncbi:hypothetical protein ACKVWH_001356 [Pyricularia oryzae]
MGDTYGGVLINMAATDAGAAGGWDDYAAARTGPPVGRSSRHGRGPVVIAGVIRLPAVPVLEKVGLPSIYRTLGHAELVLDEISVAVEQLVLVRIRPLELPIYLEKVIKLDVVT